jgi:hypothetical protein
VRTLILRMAITLDGVAASESGKDVFDHTDEGVWSDTFGMLETVDTILLGAGMHQEYLSWVSHVRSAVLLAPSGCPWRPLCYFIH